MLMIWLGSSQYRSRHYLNRTTARLAHVSLTLKRQLWERRSAKVQQPHCQSAATTLPAAAANGSNRIALRCPRLPNISALTCLDDPY